MSVLQALKSVFYGERFEPADAVQRSLLDRIATLPRLTGILPYLGWMADEGMFVLDQGTFGDQVHTFHGLLHRDGPANRIQ